MSDTNLSGSGRIPSATKGKITEPVRHWWIPTRSRSLSESSEPELATSPSYSSSPSNFSFPTTPVGSAPDPKVAIPLPAPGDDMNKFRDFFRRSSIKNMVFLDDFGTD